MPRLKPPPSQDVDPFDVEDTTPPNDAVEIKLEDADDGSVTIDTAPQNIKPAVKPNIVKTEEEEPAPEDEARKQAEELQRQLAEAGRRQTEMERQLREAQREREQERGDREQAQYDTVLAAISAEQNVLQKARGDYALAAASGDWNAAADAQQAMALGAGRLDRLEEGKRAFETKREEKPAERVVQQQPARQTLDQMIAGLPAQAQSWLRAHPEFMTDPAQNAKIQSAHGYLVNNRQIPAWTPAYFEALDEEFGFKKKPDATPSSETPSTNRRSIPVAAPVSREVPSASGVRQGSVTLTPEERRIARTSFGPIKDAKTGNLVDMTNEQKERQYAANKARLIRERQNGTYRYTTEETG